MGAVWPTDGSAHDTRRARTRPRRRAPWAASGRRRYAPGQRITPPPGRVPEKEPPMPEAVIVATARSPIGRAHKGSLTTLRSDDMAAQIVRAVVEKVPQIG